VEWYYTQDNQRCGPVAEGQLRQLVISGAIQPTDLVWKKGMHEWTPVASVAAFAAHLPPPVPNLPPSPTTPPGASQMSPQGSGPRQVSDELVHPPPVSKDPLLAAFLSGCCVAGGGQMYLGQLGKGLVIMLSQVVLSVITSGAAAPICWVIGGIDVYQIGKKLKSGYSVRKWEWF
jgi:TM2 domain-containing membrane protein YozV